MNLWPYLVQGAQVFLYAHWEGIPFTYPGAGKRVHLEWLPLNGEVRSPFDKKAGELNTHRLLLFDSKREIRPTRPSRSCFCFCSYSCPRHLFQLQPSAL